MRQTGRAGAGMAEPPEHHVLPREFREWFEKRGFTGEMSIDRFCVKMERAHHDMKRYDIPMNFTPWRGR